MDKQIVIIRHGRTEYNKLKIWQGSGVDSSLDEVGQEQASAFYKAYSQEGFDLIVYSNLKRSKETVASFLTNSVKQYECADIREISWGFHEGKPHTDKSLAEYRAVIAEWANGNYDHPFKGGESALDLQKRVKRFVDWLVQVNAKKVLICSHGRTIRCLLAIMEGRPISAMEGYSHANTGVFKADLEDGNFNFTEMNNTDHL